MHFPPNGSLLKALPSRVCALIGSLAPSTLAVAQEHAPAMSMHENFEDGAEFRWLDKPVLDSRLLGGMEDTTNRTFAGVGEASLAGDHVKEGQHSLRIHSTTGTPSIPGVLRRREQ